jgi:hypothetical protein
LGGPDNGNAGIFDPNAENPALSKERLEDKAKATAWALTYYLTQNQQIGKLHAFYAELDKLPRDMRLDKETVLKTFCTVFGLMNEDKTAINDTAFRTFARDWMKYVRELQPSWREVALTALANPNQQPGNQQGGFGLPGGFPGGPGGGGEGGSPDGGGR